MRHRNGGTIVPGVRSRANFLVELIVAVSYLAILLIGARVSFNSEYAPMARTFFLTFGIIALWRYTWLGCHLWRARKYSLDVFPELRKRADKISAQSKVDHIYVLITSYFIDPDHTFQVFDSIVRNALDYGVPTTIVAAITDEEDATALRAVLSARGNPSTIEIITQFQSGEGKRPAMAEALRTIARRLPSPNSVVVFMDGDVRLEPGALRMTIPFFLADPDLGALTTNNSANVDGGSWTREWFAVRYAQRNLYMSSLSLSDRVLCLTGRFSVYRTSMVVEPEFIDIVESDHIRHWRFGRIPLLSGDDKSTWFYLLKKRRNMLYVPDVFAIGFEKLPDKMNFFEGTTSLMTRWYRNMLQTSWRAIGLGPGHLGGFVWWALVDQRISYWTTLVGPVVAVLLALTIHPVFILFYFIWVLITRLVTSIAISFRTDRFSMLWPVLTYYNQIIGSWLKTYVMFRLNHQGWTRQPINNKVPKQRFQDVVSLILHVTTLGAFLLAVTFFTGLLNMPEDGGWMLFRLSDF